MAIKYIILLGRENGYNIAVYNANFTYTKYKSIICYKQHCIQHCIIFTPEEYLLYILSLFLSCLRSILFLTCCSNEFSLIFFFLYIIFIYKNHIIFFIYCIQSHVPLWEKNYIYIYGMETISSSI